MRARMVMAALIACMVSGAALAQPYPVRPIRIVTPFPPSSGPDIVARLVGSRLTAAWNQQVVVDNRTGAGGNLGAEIAARAAPDGYTLLMATANHAIAATLYPKLNYDLLRDFTPISLLAAAPFLLAVNSAVPAASVKELVALAKAKPGELRYGSGGSGSASHLAAEILRSMTGTDLVHIPYKGATPMVADLVGGQIQFGFLVVPVALPLLQAGKLRALGVSAPKRTPLAPELPTIAESLPGFAIAGSYGLLAPTGTPREIVSRLNAEVVKAMKTPEMRKRLTAAGAEPMGTTPEEFAAFIRAEIKRFGKAVKDSGARVE